MRYALKLGVCLVTAGTTAYVAKETGIADNIENFD